jgi:RNA polymerase sigma-70 factor (ECF subfamily)
VDDFAEFYREHYGAVVRTVTLALGDRQRAEEATQEAFTRAFRRWRGVRDMERPRAWVTVVAIRAERRRLARAPEPRELADDGMGAELDVSGAVVTRVQVGEALDRLTARQRAAVVLRYLADLPVADVARALGCAEGTAKATLHQSLAKLRVDLTEAEEVGE